MSQSERANATDGAATPTPIERRTPQEVRLPDVAPTLLTESTPIRSSAVPAPTSPEGSTAPPSRTMPTDFAIAIVPGTGQPKRGAVPGQRRQPMRGYEEQYTDIVDYCVRVTDRIWEDQDVGYIYDTYADGVRLHDDTGWKYGVERVVEGTMQAINAFPDARHYADDVIWAGDEDQGFVTSHRAINIGRHTGPWKWSEPTGKPIKLWVVANCVSKENLFYEEWVLYNTAGRLLQLGIDVPTAARQFADESGLLQITDHQRGEVERLLGGRRPERYPLQEGAGFDVEHMVRALFHDTYNRRDLSAIDRAYAQNVLWHGASNREGRGRGEVRSMARNLLSTFPDLGLQVDEVYWMGNDAEGYSVSVRWSAGGTHRGHGLYGAPTGRHAFVWGISQLYVQNGRIVEDWMMFNEFDVIAQLIGDAAPAILS
jgi:predicted ester cyclase